MHFAIHHTKQVEDESGGKYWSYAVHVNGVHHCNVRYSQLDKFNELLKREYPDRVPAKLFPGKKLFALTREQVLERWEQLERYIQHVSQDPIIGVSDEFNEFFIKAQQETRSEAAQEISLNIYLMNGNKVSVTAMSTDQTDEVLEAAMKKIGLEEKFYYYFSLFMVKKDEQGQGGMSIVRKLQDFESPYLSLEATESQHRIVIRKSYWSAKYDDDLLEDRIAMNLLYVQIIDDIDRGWLLCSDEEKIQLQRLQDKGARKELLQFARKLKYYGYLHFQPCKADYPKADSTVLMAAGEREFNIRVKTDPNKLMEGNFRVQKIHRWRLASNLAASESSYNLDPEENEKNRKTSLQFAFEYLFGKGDLRWIIVDSEQAILMSMAMQGIVDEIIREKQGKPIGKPRSMGSRSASISSSDSLSATSSAKAKPTNSPSAGKVKKRVHKKNPEVNAVFAAEDIGDDDL